MAHQILTIGLGGFGIRACEPYWQQLHWEHMLGMGGIPLENDLISGIQHIQQNKQYIEHIDKEQSDIRFKRSTNGNKQDSLCESKSNNQSWNKKKDRNALGRFITNRDDLQLTGYRQVSFNETRQGTYQPIGLLIDVAGNHHGNYRHVNQSKALQTYGYMPPIYCLGEAERDFSYTTEGSYGVAKELADGEQTSLEQCLQKIFSNAQNVRSYKIVHSMGGGIGSGVISKVMEIIQSINVSCTIETFSLFPSAVTQSFKGNECVPSHSSIQSINATLAIDSLISYSSLTHLLDNTALTAWNGIRNNNGGWQGLNQTQLLGRHKLMGHSKSRGYLYQNQLVSSMMATTSCPIRFPGSVNSPSLQKLCTSLVIYPRNHFMTPFLLARTPKSASEMFAGISGNGALCSMRMPYKESSRMFSLGILANSNSQSEMQLQMMTGQMLRSKPQFQLEWIPDPQYVGCYSGASRYHINPQINRDILNTQSLNKLANQFNRPIIQNPTVIMASSGSQHYYFQGLQKSTSLMERKKAFRWVYEKSGIDQMTLVEAISSLNDLISETVQWGTSCEVDDGQFEDEDYQP